MNNLTFKIYGTKSGRFFNPVPLSGTCLTTVPGDGGATERLPVPALS